jgi:quercetin dioxygenase-like cupin family protein
MRLSLYEFETGVETIGGNRIVYDVDAGEARFGAATVDGRALVWQLDHDEDEAAGALLSRAVHLDPFAEWIVRCDRIDFPKAGIAHTHTHPGPGIRYLLHGELEIHTEGRSTFYGPGGAWFESGPDPVLATASAHAETGFVRVLLLPAEWAGKRTIRYVDPADDGRPKLQRATVLLEHAIALPA